MNIRNDSLQYNNKATVLQLKRVILLNFVRNKCFHHNDSFFVISSVIYRKRNSLEANGDERMHDCGVTRDRR